MSIYEEAQPCLLGMWQEVLNRSNNDNQVDGNTMTTDGALAEVSPWLETESNPQRKLIKY